MDKELSDTKRLIEVHSVDTENRAQKSNLWIYRVKKETEEKEKTLGFTANLLKKALKLSEHADFSSEHWSLLSKPINPNSSQVNNGLFINIKSV